MSSGVLPPSPTPRRPIPQQGKTAAFSSWVSVSPLRVLGLSQERGRCGEGAEASVPPAFPRTQGLKHRRWESLGTVLAGLLTGQSGLM